MPPPPMALDSSGECIANQCIIQFIKTKTETKAETYFSFYIGALLFYVLTLAEAIDFLKEKADADESADADANKGEKHTEHLTKKGVGDDGATQAASDVLSMCFQFWRRVYRFLCTLKSSRNAYVFALCSLSVMVMLEMLLFTIAWNNREQYNDCKPSLQHNDLYGSMYNTMTWSAIWIRALALIDVLGCYLIARMDDFIQVFTELKTALKKKCCAPCRKQEEQTLPLANEYGNAGPNSSKV